MSDPQGSMMDPYDARSISLGTPAVICDRSRQPRIVAAQRIPGGRESHPQSASARPTPLVRCRAIHSGRDRQTTRSQSPQGDRTRRQAGYPSRLVSATGCAQVRRLPPSRLGIRPHRGRTGQSGSCYLGSNRGQHPASAQHCSSAGAESHDDMEGVHSVAHGRAHRRRLLHRGGPDLARAGDVLRAVLHRSRHPPGIFGRHHAPPGLVLDRAGGAQRNDAGHRISERLSLPAARPRQEVLPRVSRNTSGVWCGVHADTSEKSESERPRGALGTFDPGGMPLEGDPVRGEGRCSA